MAVKRIKYPRKYRRDVLACFPEGYTPREVQANALREVAEHFDVGKKFVVLEAPPGVGKSLMAVTLARYFMERRDIPDVGPKDVGAFICTKTKQLQSQYMHDFEALGMKELLGRSSFACTRAKDTCQVGGVLFRDDPCGPRCPYIVTREIALVAPITVCNYHSYLYNDRANDRPLLVCDEGHEGEAVLMDFVSLDLNVGKLPVYVQAPIPGKGAPAEDYFKWLSGPLMKTLKAYERSGGGHEETEVERLKAKVAWMIASKDKEEWIAEYWDKSPGFSLKPLTVQSFGPLLFRANARVLLMSATILDFEAFCGSLGIPSTEAAFVQTPCPFPKEHRPIYAGRLPMTRAAREESWPLMMVAIKNILEHHKNQKGLILTPSNEMLKYIVQELPRTLSNRLLLAYGEERMDRYELHCTCAAPTVLAASGFWEGADLHGKLSEFQIIPALPRPFWGGQVEARAKLDPTWYRWRTFTQFIQGTGRSVRSFEDTACTYVLDGQLLTEMERKFHSMIPPWMREAVQEIG